MDNRIIIVILNYSMIKTAYEAGYECLMLWRWLGHIAYNIDGLMQRHKTINSDKHLFMRY